MTADIRRQLAAHGVKLPAKPSEKPQVQRTPPAPPKEPRAPQAAGRSQEIVFKGRLPGNNGAGGLLRMHWVKRAQARDRFEWLVQLARLTPMSGPVRLELIRYSAGRACDFDNLVSTGKLPIDALVRNGILPDDNPQVIPERTYTQERCKPDEQRTLIRLTQLTP